MLLINRNNFFFYTAAPHVYNAAFVSSSMTLGEIKQFSLFRGIRSVELNLEFYS